MEEEHTFFVLDIFSMRFLEAGVTQIRLAECVLGGFHKVVLDLQLP